MKNKLFRALLAVAVMLVWAGISAMPSWASDLVYVQPTDDAGSYASQNDTSTFGNFATAYDNFTLASNTDITHVEWDGSYFGGTGTITGFTVDFYADNGGTPGALIASSGDVAGNADQSYLGTDASGDPTYSYVLLTGFNATAGTQYWLSITPDLSFPPQWGWETGTGGDGSSYQCFFGSCGSTPNDLAFALGVPEPGSGYLLPSGLVFLAFMFRKNLRSRFARSEYLG